MVSLKKKPGAVTGTTPSPEHKLGSDCSGNNGAEDRVLTLANSKLSSSEFVSLDGNILRLTTHYTINHLSGNSTITFLVKVWDDQPIVVLYFT